MLKYAQICSNMLKYVQICSKMLKYAQICSNKLKYAQICLNMLEYARICSKMLKYAQNWRAPVSVYVLVEVCLKDFSTAHENDAKSKNIDGQDKRFILLSNYTTATHQKITCSIFTLPFFGLVG
jgi:hypothetical protein